MFSEKKPGKKLCETLSQLGDKYTIRPITGENCIYLDLGNGYDFEVSGLDNKKKSFNATLYIWDTLADKTVERIRDITSVDMLKDCLIKAEQKYLKPQSSTVQ